MNRYWLFANLNRHLIINQFGFLQQFNRVFTDKLNALVGWCINFFISRIMMVSITIQLHKIHMVHKFHNNHGSHFSHRILLNSESSS
jgi:hypothetical protein